MRKARIVIAEMNIGSIKSFEFEFESIENLIEQIEGSFDNVKEIWGERASYNFEITVEEDTQFDEEELDILENEGYMISYQ